MSAAMQDVLQLQPRRRKSLRGFVLLVMLSALLVWLTRLPPTVLFWVGVLSAPVFVVLQLIAVGFYLKLMPACQRKMAAVGAQRLTAYLQRNLTRAYRGVLDNTLFVVVLSVINLVVPLILLMDATLIPTGIWEWLAFFAFGSALFILYIAFDSSRIILSMFDLLNKPL